MRGLQDAVQAAVNGSGLDDLLLDAGVPADLAPLANDLAGAMDGGWAFAIDFWPHLCTLFSLLAAMYIVGSNWLNQDGEESSLLETVFSIAAFCTGIASMIVLSSIGVTDAVEIPDPEDANSWFCQAQGAGVAYFQMATCMWLTAASHSVYKFVCLRQTGSTIKLTTAQETALVEAEQAAMDEGLVPPSPPKEVSVMKFYAAICIVTPMLLIAGMLIPGEEPSFSYQTLHTTGWCTISLNSPIRAFVLFYAPLIVCMFYQSGAYYFCFTQVKVKQGLLGKIDNEIMYDASAALVKKKTEAEYDRCARASSVVRLALLATSFCWSPQCLFGLMMVAANFGVVGGDPASLLWLAKLRSISAIINPMFGIALFLVIESCFNFRLRYSQAFHQKLRRIRYKLCGKMGKHKIHLDKLDADRDDDDDIPMYEKIATALYNFVWQCIELCAFAPWALVVWVPMDTFRSEVKSNKKLTYISMMYMVFIALPSLVMFVFLPSFYNVIDATLTTGDDVTAGDPKEKFAKGVAALYVIYLILVGFLAWLHLGHKHHFHAGPTVFYVLVALAPVGAMVLLFDFAWEFIEDGDKNEQDALDLKHQISIGFVYGYLASMFAVVAGTLFISRRKTELNFIREPVSHAGLTLQNAKTLVSAVLENIQLSSLLLAHSAFSGDYEPDQEPVVVFNTTLGGNGTSAVEDAGAMAAEAAAQARAAASEQLNAMAQDDWVMDFAFMKCFLFDLSYFKSVFASMADAAFDLKLAASLIAIGVWVFIVMVPIVLDTVTLARSKTFLAIYGKFAFVQETLAGPMFLIILQTFLSTLDCTKNAEGIQVLELKPSQPCWDGTHLVYAASGLTALMSFVPLACLTMVLHEDPGMHFRYTPLYYRVEVIAKAIMAMTTQFSNTMSPLYSFPILMCMSIWMILANQAMMPCCVIWANRIKMNGYLMQLWTGFSGLIAAYFWEMEMLTLGGVPLTPVGVMGIGWVVITVHNIKQMKDDRLMLVQPTKKDSQGPALAWSDYMDQKQTHRDKIQINKLNGMRLAKRPDDTKIHYNTHHEVLVMIYILRSHASAATKQRALQILSAATGSTSADAHDYNSDESSESEDESDQLAMLGVNSEVGVDDNIISDMDDVDSGMVSPGGTRRKKKEAQISVQTRRRLLGFQGDEHDADDEDYHFPEVVLVSPPSIISLLAAEFHLTRERDASGTDKFGAMWNIDKEQLGLEDGDNPDESAKDKEKRLKKEKKEEADKLKKSLKEEAKNMTPEERELEKAKRAKEKEETKIREAKEKEDEIAKKAHEKQEKKEAKHLKKKGEFVEEATETDIPLKTAEILFLLKRAKALIGQDLLDSFSDELPNRLITKANVNYIRHNPPDVLRLQVSGAGSTTMGIDKSGREEFHDDHLLEHILELPEDRIYEGSNEDEDEALRRIRSIRRMYSSEHVHKLLEDIITLPDETLERTDDMFDMKLAADEDGEMNEETRLQHEHLKKIKRLEQEKLIIENEIMHERDKALSNVSKVYLIRVLAIYAEDKAFAARIVDQIGPLTLIEYLMHGDSNLQVAATVCIYQLARFDPDCLDALEHTPGGMVFVATKLTDPESHSIVMHRIAADLLVELAKRFELRKGMIQAGLIGPLLLLVDAYAQLLMPEESLVGEKLRAKVKEAVVTFTPRHHAVDADGNLIKDQGDHHKTSAKAGTLMDTNDIEPWCPFSLKGTLPHATHVLLSVLRVFQQLSDEDKFRSEFVGRHKGLTWIRDYCYQIDTDDAKVMAMRLLLGISVDPFGFWDIMEDPKMLSYYIKMMKYKEDVSNWQVEPEPVLKPGEWKNIAESVQVELRKAREAGTKTLELEMDGVTYTVDMVGWTRTFKTTGRQQPLRIEPMVMHSRDMVLRMRMHRVAQFLDLKHVNGVKLSSAGHKMRLVVIEKMSNAEMKAHSMAHDANLLEVVRERVLDECFAIISEASISDHEPVRVAAISVLTSVCGTVMHLEDMIFDRVFEHMHIIRQQCIDAKDMVMYESVAVSMVSMCRNHRKGQVVDRLHTGEEVFEQMWMYHHMLGKDLKQVVQTPFWRRVQEVVTPDLVKLITDAPNTSHSHAEQKTIYCSQLPVMAFFEAKAVAKRDAQRAREEAEPGHYLVELKHTTRDKIDEGVKKATEFAKKLAQHKKKNRKEKKEEKKKEKAYDLLLSRQVAAKDDAMAEADEVIKYKDAELDRQLKEEEEVKANPGAVAALGAFGVSATPDMTKAGDEAPMKFGNPLAEMDDAADADAPPSPDATTAAVAGADGAIPAAIAVAVPVNNFEEQRKQAAIDKKENAKKKKEEEKAKKKAEAEARKATKDAAKKKKQEEKALSKTAIANPLQPQATEDALNPDTPDALAPADGEAGPGLAALLAASATPQDAVFVGETVESEEDEVELEFNGVLPPFIRVLYQLPDEISAVSGALTPQSDIRLKHKQMYDGGFSQGELFNGCPSYDHTAMLQVRTPLGDIVAEKIGHLSVIRGTRTDRWFLCADQDHLDDEDAHDVFLITPKGNLPIGEFPWRLQGGGEVTLTLEACNSLAKANVASAAGAEPAEPAEDDINRLKVL